MLSLRFTFLFSYLRNFLLSSLCSSLSVEELTDRPVNIPIATNPNADGLSIATVDMIEFSPCGRYLALRHQVYSSTIWIWDIAEDSVNHLLLKRPVSGASTIHRWFVEHSLIFFGNEKNYNRHDSSRCVLESEFSSVDDIQRESSDLRVVGWSSGHVLSVSERHDRAVRTMASPREDVGSQRLQQDRDNAAQPVTGADDDVDIVSCTFLIAILFTYLLICFIDSQIKR